MPINKSLRQPPSDIAQQEAYIMELEEQVIRLGHQVLDIARELDDSKRQILESYIDSMAELEFLTVTYAYQQGKSQGLRHSAK